MPGPSLLIQVVDALPGIGGFKFGAYLLKHHKGHPDDPRSPLYINLRFLQSHPALLVKTARVYVNLIRREQLVFDRIVPVPVAALPLATLVSVMLDKPMITPRLAPKDHGEISQIDGTYQEGETGLIIDDLVTEATSKLEIAELVRGKGLVVNDCVVLVDREQGGREQLAAAGITLHSATNNHQLLDRYEQTGRATPTALEICQRYLAGGLVKGWENEVEPGWDRIS